jgi:hypothetical protein
MIWFYANRSTLTEASGVCLPFCNGDGEALRGNRAGHSEILGEIAHVGSRVSGGLGKGLPRGWQGYGTERGLSRILEAI